MIRCATPGIPCTAVVVLDADDDAVARRRSITSGVSGIRSSAAGALARAIAPETMRIYANVTNARTPVRPSDRDPMPVATPVINTEITSGTTVILIALTHNPPNGSIRPTTRSTVGLALAAARLPRMKPAASAART